VFDYGVNSGIGRAAKVLQRLLGLADDGVVGPRTLAAAACADAGRLIDAICDERLAFLQGLRTWSVFGNGWGRRVREVRAAALAIAARNIATCKMPARKADAGDRNADAGAPEPPAPPAPPRRRLSSAISPPLSITSFTTANNKPKGRSRSSSNQTKGRSRPSSQTKGRSRPSSNQTKGRSRPSTKEPDMHLVIDLVLFAALVYVVVDFVRSYKATNGTLWQRLLATGRHSATSCGSASPSRSPALPTP